MTAGASHNTTETADAPAASTRSRPGEPPIVAAQRLTKIFKDFWLRDRARAVDGIDFHIDRGEIFGLLGPNGSGKSTTIKMILGLLKRSGGRLAVFGRAPSDVDIKKRIGYLPEESYLYPYLNARETLDYYGKLFQLDRKTRTRRIDELLDMVGLAAVQHRQVNEYSKGMQRRIGIAQALINDPEFLILDEPTTGLDPIGTRQVKDLIVALGRRGKTILLSSHLLADVEDCVSRMVILYGGKIREQGTCDDLLTAKEKSVIETDALDDDTVAEIRGVLERRSHTVERITAPRQRLEDLFIDIVERARAERAATSGADNAGGTAAFLRGDQRDETDSGEHLIESLVAGDQTNEPATAEPPTEADTQPPAENTSREVIEGLVGQQNTTPDAEPAEPRAEHDTRRREAERGIDDSVIDSLLGDADKNRPDRGA